MAKITASDGATRDYFGASVAINGDTAFVGAWGDNEAGTESGSAYVYQRDEGGVHNWGEVTKINASDAGVYDRFGVSVAISGDTAIVGNRFGDYATHGPFTGSAYIYQRDEGSIDNWGEVAKFNLGDEAWWDEFGWPVAIDGDTVIVGSSGTRSAYVYRRDEGGIDNWGEAAMITETESVLSYFGSSIALSGNTVIVGAPGHNDNGYLSGSAHVYRRDEGGAENWGYVTKITTSDVGIGDWFGGSVALSGDTAIVGAPEPSWQRGFSPDGPGTGSAYVFYATWCATDADCDDNGIDDACELADCGGDPGCDDCDGNGILDRCDIAGGSSGDCNANGIPDDCEILKGTSLDCQVNNIPDECDIASGAAPDVNGNGVPDECEPPCTDNATCDDSDSCSFDRCIDTLCWHDEGALYGDVAGEAGVCGPDGDVNLSDILAVLDAFAGQYAEGCEPVNVDIAGAQGSCQPDDSIDLSDILGVLNAFQGAATCCGEGP